MNKEFYAGNRQRLYANLAPGELLVVFAGEEIRKSADAFYPFHADRNFLYLTGISQKKSILMARKAADGAVSEWLYLLPKDAMAERWTGKRLNAGEAEALSGISDVRDLALFSDQFHGLASQCSKVWLDLHRQSPEDADHAAHTFAHTVQREYPYLAIGNLNPYLRRLRTIKQPCEIAALRKAEEITKAGILAMMRVSHPGMYEYQYKAEFDRALGQFSPSEPGFTSIISAGADNFFIHYDSYTGQAQDGDMVLNDVGAQWENLTTDVSRSWPCNGKFSEKQKLLYECALKTSDYLFSIIRPGMKMADVDATIRSYNARLLVEAGVMDSVEKVGTYMWHGGAHHIGYDVHDAVEKPEIIAPGMVFCVDVGIYHEEWGIGFRLEDNCLVTEDGCENLSAAIPRTVEEIEAVMAK
ncbi:MAG: aminopeptidase P N-terminal domain-containing protein [Candidatus Faecousia sp.]|nr:aminopeptidase P N-terminal domain-containing protein [Candidatus Faecousia sp.]